LKEDIGLLVSPPIQAIISILTDFLQLFLGLGAVRNDDLVDLAGFIDVFDMSAEREGIVLGITGILKGLQNLGNIANHPELSHVHLVELNINFVLRSLGFAGLICDFTDIPKGTNVTPQSFPIFVIEEVNFGLGNFNTASMLAEECFILTILSIEALVVVEELFILDQIVNFSE
jgi:hypothetical protein